MKEKTTLRKFVYNQIYLRTPAWDMTRQIVKKDTCSWNNCSRTRNLHLHHMSYTGFQWWYLLFRLSLVALVLSVFFPALLKYALVALAFLAFCPDFLSRWATLCDYHHDLIHLQERTK
jgi:hypothetical protein